MSVSGLATGIWAGEMGSPQGLAGHEWRCDPGAVSELVLILNRLMFPLPLYQVADCVGRTVLVNVLGIPAAKFNDDRLGRTLDGLYPHLETLWLEVVEVALLKAEVARWSSNRPVR
jgi:hypothetical protein